MERCLGSAASERTQKLAVQLVGSLLVHKTRQTLSLRVHNRSIPEVILNLLNRTYRSARTAGSDLTCPDVSFVVSNRQVLALLDVHSDASLLQCLVTCLSLALKLECKQMSDDEERF